MSLMASVTCTVSRSSYWYGMGKTCAKDLPIARTAAYIVAVEA